MKDNRFGNMIIILIVILLTLIINGKFFFRSTGNLFLLVYGLSVTMVTLTFFIISRIKYKDPSKELTKKKYYDRKEPFISIILAVYNEEKIISQCIDSLVKSTYEKREIIIVNDCSTDNTLQVLNKYKSNPDITIINLKKNVGKKKAITEALKIAKGTIYVMTDSDCVIEKTAIARIIEIFIHNNDVGAVSGHGRALNANANIWTKIQDTWYEGQFSIKKAFESSYGCVSCVSGPLAVFRKEAIFNYIPAWAQDQFLGNEFKFATDRTLTAYILGGKYIGKELKRKYSHSWFVTSKNYPEKEWKSIYCKSAKVWTNVPDTFRKIINQHIRWKKSFIRSLFFTGRFFWKKPFFPALFWYLKIVYVFIGPFIVARQLLILPTMGNILAPILYLGGICLIGLMYGLAYKIENPNCHRWLYRPFMSLLSTLVLSWLIFYSALTIKKQIWLRA